MLDLLTGDRQLATGDPLQMLMDFSAAHLLLKKKPPQFPVAVSSV
jgi:hypothetical protein